MGIFSKKQKIVTRFAPSPTGFLHVGGVRTALFAWAYAKQNNGKFILRVEDTDKEREVEGSVEHIMESLKWLGIIWDEGPDIGGPSAPYFQSKRLENYKKYARILVEKGLAYADPYTEGELEKFRKTAEEEHKAFLYRDHRPENPPVWDGAQALRLKVSQIKSYEWHDLVRGDLKAGPEALDDFILIKSDGYPTYNFAHIIDDLEMGVTHIFRADEFISSTPKFLSLYDALDIKRPEFVTLPPIMTPDGKKKLGKRDGAKDILEYRKEGYLASAMVNFLAFIGWNPGDEKEVLTVQEFVSLFKLEQIHKAGGRFNEEKLKWVNREHLLMLSDDDFKASIEKYLSNAIKNSPLYHSIITKIIPVIKDRVSVACEVGDMETSGELSYFLQKPTIETEKLLGKDNSKESTKIHIEKIVEILGKISENDFTKENIKNAIWDYATKEGRGSVLWPMRYALSGKEKSPDPFVLAEILGKKETEERLKIALDRL